MWAALSSTQFLSWGGRGGCSQLVSVLEPPGHQKALAKPGLNCGKSALNLSLTSHTGHMEMKPPQRIVWLILGALMLAGWALIIWVAAQVTQTALSTLQYVVDLAQYKP